MSWLTHTEELLDAQRPISGDPKVIEVELAKHHVSAFSFHLSIYWFETKCCHQQPLDTVCTIENQAWWHLWK